MHGDRHIKKQLVNCKKIATPVQAKQSPLPDGRTNPIAPLKPSTCQLKSRPRAPEMYRPQPVPRVLQKKELPDRPTIPKTPTANNVHGQAAIQRQSGPGHRPSRINRVHPGSSTQPLMKSVTATRPAPRKVNFPSRSVMQLAAASAAAPKSESTTITLSIGRKPFTATNSGGHAEMNALDAYLKTCGETKAKAFEEAKRELTSGLTLKVSCKGKNVCGSCTMILQALGFKVETGTNFSNEKSGGVSWVTTTLVRDFLKYMGLESVLNAAVEAGAKG